MNTSSNPSTLSCPYCSLSFSDLYLLKDHLKISHKEISSFIKQSFIIEQSKEQEINKITTLKAKKEKIRAARKRFNSITKKIIASKTVLSPAQKRARNRRKKKAIKHKSVFAKPTAFESNRKRH